ncbi:transposase [Streptomyces caelestis]|uniref:Transposase n=1 Tax=Streptomyces heliomycini TaxID=284032 RepID=A0ABV5LF93_9ACTN
MGSKSNRSRRYTEEFKRDAVALVRSSGRTVTEAARELGVSAEGLRNWVRQDQADRGQHVTRNPRGCVSPCAAVHVAAAAADACCRHRA